MAVSLLKFILSFALLTALGATPLALAEQALGQGQGMRASYYVPTIPADMSDVEFYLMTGSPGYEVNDRFGHTAIRVVNRAEGTDVAFNWGKFSFDDPGFLWKFFRGQLDYSMAVRTFQRDVALYNNMNRRVVMDRLNLTSVQKRSLLSKIAWNAEPGRRKFSYQYWYKNCATIPRDFFDEVLGGQLKSRFAAMPTHRVFRDYVRRNLTYSPFIVPLLDVLMNGNIDRPISAWDDMFLPANLHHWLQTLPAFDDSGRPLPDTKLLGDQQLLLDNPEVYSARFNDFLVAILPMLVGLAVAALVFVSGLNPATLAYRGLGVATIWWSLLSGILGWTLALNWGFSGHPDGWHNVNLMLFWPSDLLFLPAGVELMRRGVAARGVGLIRRYGRTYCVLHVLSLILLCVLTATKFSHQNVWQVVTWFGLPTAALRAVLWLRGFQLPSISSQERVAASGQNGTGRVGRQARSQG
jgi:hypothetical protein